MNSKGLNSRIYKQFNMCVCVCVCVCVCINSIVLAQKQKYIPMEQIENMVINPSTYGHFIFDKGGKKIQYSFNTWSWEN